jgi:hypothetical protein
VVAQELVADPVELVGGHSRHDVRADELAGLGGQAAGDPQRRDDGRGYGRHVGECSFGP